VHSCPGCGQACYCNGDVDDCPVDPSAADDCLHCDPFDDEHEEEPDGAPSPHEKDGRP
jgi:hypothetical protein